MMNNMPPYGMFPPMTGPNMGPGNNWQDNNQNLNERINYPFIKSINFKTTFYE